MVPIPFGSRLIACCWHGLWPLGKLRFMLSQEIPHPQSDGGWSSGCFQTSEGEVVSCVLLGQHRNVGPG